MAAEKAELKMMEWLLLSGADPNARMENGSTALHVLAVRSAAYWCQDKAARPALRQRFVECARLLLLGANVDAITNMGITPVSMALAIGSQVRV